MSVCPHSLVWVPSCTPFCLCCLEQAQCFVLSRQVLCHCMASPCSMWKSRAMVYEKCVEATGQHGEVGPFLHYVGYGNRTQVARFAGQMHLFVESSPDYQFCLFSFLDLFSYLCVCVCCVCTRVSDSLGLELQVTDCKLPMWVWETDLDHPLEGQ